MSTCHETLKIQVLHASAPPSLWSGSPRTRRVLHVIACFKAAAVAQCTVFLRHTIARRATPPTDPRIEALTQRERQSAINTDVGTLGVRDHLLACINGIYRASVRAISLELFGGPQELVDVTQHLGRRPSILSINSLGD